MPRKDLIQYRRGATEQWLAANPVLAAGEVGFDTEVNEIRIGDGTRQWVALEPIGGNLSDEEIAAAIDAWLSENPLEGVTQQQLTAAIAAIELTPGPPGDPGKDGKDGDPGPPGPSAVSANAGNLLKLGTDSLPMLDPADIPGGGGGGGSIDWLEMPVPAETLGTSQITWALHRTGNIVHLKARVNGTPTGTSLGLLPDGYRMPTGFWGSDDTAFMLVRGGTTNIVNALRIQYGNQVSILAQSTVNGTCMVSWPTDDPLPR